MEGEDTDAALMKYLYIRMKNATADCMMAHSIPREVQGGIQVSERSLETGIC